MNKSRPSVHVFLTLIAAILTVYATTGFAADPSWTRIKEKGELVVGFCAQYPPFEFKTETGEFKGFDVDLANAMGNVLGIPVTFRDGEWQGLIAGMKNGEYDILVTCMGKTTAREQNVNFSDVYYQLTEVIIVRKDENRIKAKADLKGKVVGAQMATSSETVLDKLSDLVGEARKYNYTTEAFLDLKHKRIDAVVCGIAYAIVQMKKDPSYKIVGEPLNATEIVMALPKDANDLTDRINAALDKIRTDGRYKEIHDKWLNVNKQDS